MITVIYMIYIHIYSKPGEMHAKTNKSHFAWCNAKNSLSKCLLAFIYAAVTRQQWWEQGNSVTSKMESI